ncbi:root phototropism protein 3 [Coffea eugenioides]|uniref:Root phototropism protein 3-like isoform X1 n=2 Tax=Coffea arabica TaxID=13443 RepID=A0A6P6WBI1_COFAR|nr:root phototropism protein 3-like isoform X1 [Coffea arabica]XP_027112818.1 root phototropism protein 3-like isoform X1 [Coffea arabica]XP_027160274.1 root phototropism protein 3 [Coffea eugenioides]
MWDAESETGGGRDYSNGVLSISKHGLKTDGFEQRGQSWYVATDIPSDFLVQIGDVNFHLHKYPLLSRSGKLNRIIYESREDLNKIVLDDLPGGPEAFELAAKFCYGIAVDLTANNISGLRCAAEYLEMTEDLEEGNLIFKTEAFLSYVVLSSWRDSILVLKNSEKLSPWAENLQIVRRCSESIAWKACANPKGIRWQYTGRPPKVSSPSWNEMKDSSPSRNQQVPPDWWFEDVSILRIDHFVRVITAIKVKGMRHELIGAAIMHYAAKWLPGLITEGSAAADEGSNYSHANDINRSWKGGLHMIVAGTKEDIPTVQAKDQRMIIESLISLIPPQKDSVSCSFLLRLLRMANLLKVAAALVTELEKRVGMQFEQATLADLLIPSYNKSETLYDVDLVQRLLEHFLVQEQTESSSPSRQSFAEAPQRGTNPNAKMRVARLVDSYLTEVSRDRNLSLTKFQVLAEALPDSARTCDDGLYRAVDSYLKAHPTLSEHERKRLCRVMDCQKLSIDACMHAAQNERLPLRVVVQVLFSEQVKISNAIASSSLKEAGESHYQPMVSTRKTLLEGTPQSFQEGWATAKKDINTLKFELETVKAKYLELQNDFETLQRQFDKMAKPKQTFAWTSGWKKLGKLTKMSNLENHDDGPQISNPEQPKKAPRRWRNSVS